MRIAVLASNFIKIPPHPSDVPMGYSGAPEGIVFKLTEGLVKRGHKVTLFASGDSKTSATLFSVTSKATAKDKNIGIGLHEAYEYLLISKAYELAKKGMFDIIHSHFDRKSAYFAPLVSTPTVSTLHSPLDHITPILSKFKKTQYYVSISDVQRRTLPDLNYAATIYHGIDLDNYPFNLNDNGYILFVGRIVPEKGAHIAIKVARQIGQKLIILGWSAKQKLKYFQEEIKPYVDGRNIVRHGFITRSSLKEYLKLAKVLVFPISWEEPFGLVMIEAMACGTPVIAYAKGSVPEVIVDGQTGYIVNNSPEDKRGEWLIKRTGVEGFVEAMQRINSMSSEDYNKMRQNCRKHVQDHFTIKKMIEGYEGVYKKILSDNR